jgi:hypothetical protein
VIRGCQKAFADVFDPDAARDRLAEQLKMAIADAERPYREDAIGLTVIMKAAVDDAE